MRHSSKRILLASALAAVTALLAACGGGNVRPMETLESTTMDQVCTKWRRSEVFSRPVVIQHEDVWKELQKQMGKQLRDVNFDTYMVVGGFAYEPDMPKEEGAGLKDRGYKVKIKSISRSDDAYTIRLSVKSAPNVLKAAGPLHYALAIIPRTLTPSVFYINGAKYVAAPEPAFRKRQKSATTLIKETYGNK